MQINLNILAIVNTYTPEKITDLLYNMKFLETGKVLKVQKRIEEVTFVSYLVVFQLIYSIDARGLLPKELLLKVGKPDIIGMDNKREVMFYDKIARLMEFPPTPLCLEAVYDDRTNCSLILMANLKKTHTDLKANHVQMSTAESCMKTVKKFAQFHASWWGNPLLQLEPYRPKWLQTPKEQAEMFNMMFQSFSNEMQFQIDESVLKLYEYVLTKLEILLEIMSCKVQTLIHGDAHFGNVLVPLDGNGEVFLIDWSDWHSGMAMDDLAHMLALGYSSDQRKKNESRLFNTYLNELATHGIAYGGAEAEEDYKRCVIKNLFIPIFQWYHHVPSNIWNCNFERVVVSYYDLKCVEALERL